MKRLAYFIQGSILIILAGLVPERAVSQVPEGLQARIASVVVDSRNPDLLAVIGTAAGPGFARYEIEVGRGEFPVRWIRLSRSTAPKINAPLAQWKTGKLATELYAIRLTVRDSQGRSLSDRIILDLGDYRPDLLIDGLSVKAADRRVKIRGEVRNQGPRAVEPAFSLSFFLSAGREPDADSVLLGKHTFSGLAAGAGESIETDLEIPAGLRDGIYFLLGMVDPDERIVEGREDNNILAAHDSLAFAPDLMVADLRPRVVQSATQLDLTVDVVNRGTRSVKKSFWVSFHLSVDGRIGEGDIHLGRLQVQDLKASESRRLEALYNLPGSLSPGRYSVLARLDPEGRVVESSRENNDYWGGSLIIGPNLVPRSLSAQLEGGDRIILQDRIENPTRFPSSRPARVHYDLVRAETGDRRELGGREVSPLGPDEVSSRRLSFAIPDLEPDRYYVVGRLEPDPDELEMETADNQFQSPVIEIGPDLLIGALSIQLSADGNKILVKDTVVNRGNRPAKGPIRIGFFLEESMASGGRDNLLGTRVLEGLSAGAETSGESSLALPPGVSPATVAIRAVVNSDGWVPEIGTANNSRLSNRLLEQDVDLVLRSLSASLLSDGDSVAVTDTVQNLGPDDLAQSFIIGYYLADQASAITDRRLLGERRLDNLKAGATSTRTTVVRLPADLPAGKLSVLARIDPWGTIGERNRLNNEYWGSSLHFGPDLLIRDLDGEIVAENGEVKVSFVVINGGNRPAPPGIRIVTQLVGETGSVVASLGTSRLEPLTAGSRQSVRSVFPIPDSARNGAYRLRTILDPDSDLPEIDKTNNEAMGPEFQLGPDLVVEAVQFSLSPDATQLTIMDRVGNRGNRAAVGEIGVIYLLSRNWTIERSDIPLGDRVIGRLDPGETSAGRQIFPIEAMKIPAGQYYILVRVMAEPSVQETDAANNMRPTIKPVVIRQGNRTGR